MKNNINGTIFIKQQKDNTRYHAKKAALAEIINYTNVIVVQENKPVLVSQLLDRYKSCYAEQNVDISDLHSYTVQNLSKQLLIHIPEIEINAKNFKTVAWKKGAMTYEEALKIATLSTESNEHLLWKCAMLLRQDILNLENKQLQEPVNVDGIMQGEVSIPESVSSFFKTLYTGSRLSNEGTSSKKARLVASTSSDVVYSCSGGKLLPGKHLSLGFALKSMTGSKNIVTLMNRYSHCASSETVRRLDMSLEATINQSSSVVPDGIQKVPGRCTGLAWDNFDINLETPSGKDTIHHTYGICYQNIDDNISTENLTTPSSTGSTKRKRFTKVSPPKDVDLEPYWKKSKVTNKFGFSITEVYAPSLYADASTMDILWMMAANLFSITPMWTGWNAMKTTEIPTKQVLSYMKNIPLPPTRDDVVMQTLKVSQEVAAECGDDYVLVAYDLAVAKIARQIQLEKKPQFDNCFIPFGQFHTIGSLYSSLGRVIEGSGGPYVLSEAGILAMGSMNKFLKGSMYNRCRRGHTLLATAMHGLHFERFIDDVNIPPSTLIQLNKWANSKDKIAQPECITFLAHQYSLYMEDTLNGERGKTAKYWMNYVRIADFIHLLQRAIKTNDIDLYAYALFEVTSLFFVTNHHNYARWMSLYSLDLANLKNTKPAVEAMLKNGGFSVNRTGKPFAGVGVDMALEQTINASAKSRLKGIMAFADVATAVNRWLVTASMKTKLMNAVLTDADMKEPNEDIKQLRPTQIEKDKADLEIVKQVISSTINPFKADVNQDVLFNIKTGFAASPKTENYLLNLQEVGEQRRDDFIKECTENSERFSKPISKITITNFASENFQKKNKSKKASEIANIKGTRDLFGRLLFLSAKKGISLDKVFEYPILPEPACFTHPDGSIRQNDKAKVGDLLKREVSSFTKPSDVNTAVIDGMFLVNSDPKSSPTSGLARSILRRALKLTDHRVDLCFDVYESPGIKDVKRNERGNVNTELVFSFGPGQKTPSNLTEMLKLDDFKKEFLRFLVKEFENPECATILGEKVLFCSVDNQCKKFQSIEGILRVEDVPELFGYHLEADTRVMFHVMHADKEIGGNTIVRGTDTDIFVVLVTNASKVQNSLWFDTGLDFDNSRACINIKEVSEKIEYSRALPGIYAFTGIDYIPAFFKKGKERPITLLRSNQRYLKAFASLGEVPLTAEVINTIEEFTCMMYRQPRCKKVNDAIKAEFDKKCKPKAKGNPLDGIKSIDPTTFPPCSQVLLQQIKRAWFIANLYKSASEAYPVFDLCPLDYGFQLTDDKEQLEMKWFDGDQVPRDVEDMTIDEEDGEESDNEVDDEEDENDDEPEDI